MSENIFLFIFLIIFIFLIWIVWILGKKKKFLNKKMVQKFSEKIQDTKNLDPAYSILESHKIFIKLLSHHPKIRGKKLSASEKIKICEALFPFPQRIWRINRLRNKIAHETEVGVKKSEAEQARLDLIRALKSLS